MAHSQWFKSNLTCHAIRLTPGQSITGEIVKFVVSNGLQSAFILTCVGSITKARIRLAHATASESQDIVDLDDRYEISSLVGTVSSAGKFHLHTTLGDYKGTAISGHVVGNMIVHTTAEIVIGECSDLVFSREPDEQTGFTELTIKKKG